MKYGTRHRDIEHSSRTVAAHQLSLSIQNDRAVQVVASMASDPVDCIELLAMLGLDPHGTGLTDESSLLA